MSEDNTAPTPTDSASKTKHGCNDLHLSVWGKVHFQESVQPGLDDNVKVYGGNKVRCSINGKKVWAKLDSGLSETVMSRSLALRLGLLEGDEEIVKVKVTAATGTEKFEGVKLSHIIVTFDNGKQVCDAPLVLPETVHLLRDESSLVMGLPVLRRGSMVQTFRRQGSTLSIGCPSCVLEPGPRYKGVGIFLVLPKRPRGCFKRVLVSTGMYNFYCSGRVRDKFRRRSRKRCGPHRAILDLGRKHILKEIPLKVLPNTVADFIMGRQFLHKNEATIDFKYHLIFISRDGSMSAIVFLQERL